MPPGYPNGGMENPQITFMTPSVIKNGKEAVDVAAHEIAHSWFGNLVTCGNWSHTWLNEGFTVFVENAIVRSFFGEDNYNENVFLRLYELNQTITPNTKNEEYTKLLCNPHRLCPEYCFTRVQYVKGFLLVHKLQVRSHNW